jgi:hypothetical protein
MNSLDPKQKKIINSLNKSSRLDNSDEKLIYDFNKPSIINKDNIMQIIKLASIPHKKCNLHIKDILKIDLEKYNEKNNVIENKYNILSDKISIYIEPTIIPLFISYIISKGDDFYNYVLENPDIVLYKEQEFYDYILENPELLL